MIHVVILKLHSKLLVLTPVGLIVKWYLIYGWSKLWQRYDQQGALSQPRQPQREALVNTKIISVPLWGGLRVTHIQVDPKFTYKVAWVMLKLPQQVALTQLNGQVSTQVRGIEMTYKGLLHTTKIHFILQKWRFCQLKTNFDSKTTPTISTYCIHNSSQCLC